MSRLIDADKLKEEFDDKCAYECAICKYSKDFAPCKLIDNAPTVEPKLSDEQIEKIIDLLETEWGYEGIREDVSRILRGGRE